MPVVAQAGDDAVTAVARTYQAFARLEARGRSPAYEALAESVAGDAALVRFIASLPPAKRQPNLLFAAARYLLGAPPAIGSLRELASQSRAELTDLILARRTQTNEPARCAVRLSRPDEVDAEFAAWLSEAYRVGAQEHLRRRLFDGDRVGR